MLLLRRPSGKQHPLRDDTGSATAELAVALPAVALVLGLCLAAIMLAANQVQITDAAADAARALGRGESASTADSLATKVAGTGVRVSSTVKGEFVCATLTRRPNGLLWMVELTATSCALQGGK